MLAPETTLHGGWPNLWPQGVREEPRGRGELNDKPLCCASPGAELCHQNPALSTACPLGHPFLPLEKPGESRRCQPPSAQPPRCSSISAQLHWGVREPRSHLSNWFCHLSLVRLLLFRHLHPTSWKHHARSMEVHVLHAKYLHPQHLRAACWDAHRLWAGWQLPPLGKETQGRWGHPFLLARTSGMSVNLFIAGVTALSALPDNGGGSDAF